MHSEAEQIVPALRNHPSLAIWCGGNELAHEDGRPLDHAPVLDALAGVVRRLDPDRHWLPTSPSGPTFSSTAAGEQHDVHGPWEHQGLDDHYRLYNEGRSLLLSEFGVEGMSNVRAIESVVPTDWQTLPTKGAPVWEHLGRWWNNEPLVQDAFGGRLTDIATLSRASQFLQADGLRYAVEANRRRAISCGVLPWQFNEPFPNGWCTSAVDYFGEPKAAYHYVRRAYRERHVSAELAAPRVDELHATVWAWSERTPLTTTVRARVLRLDGTVIRSASWEVSLSAGQPARAGVIDCSAAELDGRPFLLDLELGLDRTSNRYLLTAGEDFGALLDLPPAELDVQFDAETLRLRNDGPSVVPLLRVLDARAAADPGWITWDDNAIDLLPGEQRVLRGRWTGTAERRIAIDSWNGRYAIDG
jgi:beta-mannosidase